jgi:hypothetical protein
MQDNINTNINDNINNNTNDNDNAAVQRQETDSTAKTQPPIATAANCTNIKKSKRPLNKDTITKNPEKKAMFIDLYIQYCNGEIKRLADIAKKMGITSQGVTYLRKRLAPDISQYHAFLADKKLAQALNTKKIDKNIIRAVEIAYLKSGDINKNNNQNLTQVNVNFGDMIQDELDKQHDAEED